MATGSAHITVGRDSGDVRGADNRAIQIAVDALPADGGTVQILPGEYECIDAVHLGSRVRLVGAGEKTVLRRADGFSVPLGISADYGQLKITPVDISRFRVGQGLYVRDERSGGWMDSVVTVARIEGGAIHFAEGLVMDYSEERGGEVVASGALVSGVDVEDVTVEGLMIDGNKDNNIEVGGCRSGGVYFHRASRVRIAGVAVKDFAGDGISFQTTRDFTLEDVSSCGSTSIGLHPGTGSARVHVDGGVFSDNHHDGFFLCWRVQEGRFEKITCERNGRAGINVGHKDTDNVFVGCRLRENARAGLLFREENANNGGHRNRFEGCLVENNNGSGIEVEGEVYDVVFGGCTVRDTRGKQAKQRVGLLLGEKARRFKMTGSTWDGHPDGNIRDLSGAAGGHSLDG